MRYLVIATVWSDVDEKQIKKAVGLFDKYMNAKIFCEAYNKHYSANAEIKEFTAILN